MNLVFLSDDCIKSVNLFCILNSITVCTNGTYGTGCTQTCHCDVGSSCDIYSGICSGGCETGWSGDNCQSKSWSAMVTNNVT